MGLPSDYERQLANIIRFGEITDIDMKSKPPMVRVAIDDDVKTDWMPYGQPAVGGFSMWVPPTIGTHGIVLSEGGENEVCRFLPMYCCENNTPSLGGDDFQIKFKNGDSITHNSKTGDLIFNITGDLTINSKKNIFLNAEQQIVAKAKSNAVLQSDACAVLKSPQNYSDAPTTFLGGGLSQGSAPSASSAKQIFSKAVDYSVKLLGKMFVQDIDANKIDAKGVNANGVDLEGHVHSRVEPGSGTSGKPQK